MRTWVWVVGVGVTGFSTGCGWDDEQASELRQRAQAVETPASVTVPTFDITLPVGADIGTFGVVARGGLWLKDRASVVEAAGQNIPLYNLGQVRTDLGVGVSTASVTTAASAFLANNARVQGDLISSGTVTLQQGAQVLGSLVRNAPLPEVQVQTLTQEVAPNNADNRNAWSGQTLPLPPGGYGKLAVYTGARTKLSSGTYAFSDLQLEPDSILELNFVDGAGPVVLFVDKISAFRGRIVSTSGTAAKLLVVYTGTTTIRLERATGLTLVAPRAKVELATGGTTYEGSVFAQGIQLEPDVRLKYVPFEFWDWLLPPKPTVSCVMPSGRGQFVAAFGYDNPRPTPVTIPAGAHNAFTPAPTVPFTPRTLFEPGAHQRVIWVPMPATGVTWNLYGQSATATLDAPGCEFPEVTGSVQPPTDGRPLPRPGVEQAPAPSLNRFTFENADAPGAFDGVGNVDDPSDGSTPHDQPAEAGRWPAVTAGGLIEEPLLPVTLRTVTTFHDDNWPEKVDVVAFSKIAGHLRPWSQATTSGLTVTKEHVEMVPRRSNVPIEFTQLELNDFKGQEVIRSELQYDMATGLLSGFVESAKIEGTWVFGESVFSNNFQSFAKVPVNPTGETVFGFYDDNRIRFSVSSPVDSAATVKVCAHWSAYFVDEAIPDSALGRHEGLVGKALSVDARIKAYPAAYSEYFLSVKGATASFSQSGFLEGDGCVSVPASALIYRESVTDGSAGGISLFMRIASNLKRNSPQGDIAFHVADGRRTALLQPYDSVFQFTRFDQDASWSVQDGFRIPPDTVPLMSASYSHGSTVTATMAHAMHRMEAARIELPPGDYHVLVDEGTEAGTLDFAGKVVPDSNFTGNPEPTDPFQFERIEIGPGFFPCSDTPASATECRAACSVGNTSLCKGGQYCATASDPGQGCVPGVDCFCAYPGQGSWKFSTTHELGHMLQNVFRGGISNLDGYQFDCTRSAPNAPTCLLPEEGVAIDARGTGETSLVDPPRMDELCGCQHVSLTASPLHCIQSIERTSRADSEGFGHFVSALMWNDLPGATTPNPDCRFTYYKEFLDLAPSTDPNVPGGVGCRVSGDVSACSDYVLRNGDVGVVTLPPLSLDCGSPVKWRNQMRCGVDMSVQRHLAKPLMGTEYDWLTFLYALNKQISFSELMSIYNHACHPEHGGEAAGLMEVLCAEDSPVDPSAPLRDVSGKKLSWLDTTVTAKDSQGMDQIDPITMRPIVLGEYGGFLDGAKRKWGPGTLFDDIELLGDLHGVSEDVSP